VAQASALGVLRCVNTAGARTSPLSLNCVASMMRWLPKSVGSRADAQVTAVRISPLAASSPWISSLHAVVEQEGLSPEMTDEFPDHINVLRFERREIEKVLGVAIHGVRDDRIWPDRLVAVLHLLRGHILKEQDGVFPAARVVLVAG